MNATDPTAAPTTHDFNDGNGPVPAHRHAKGGGWVADTAKVDAAAFVDETASVGRYASVGRGASVGEGASVGRGQKVGDNAQPAPQIPVIENIDAVILAAIETQGCGLNMGDWHSCETTHCRGGWAIHKAGAAGYALEAFFGTELAATLIYKRSRPNTRIPDFYASDEAALRDIREHAAQQTAAAS